MTGYSRGSTSASYRYDINGVRIGKTVNGTTTEYFAPNGKILAESTGTTNTYYLYDQNGLPEGMRRGGKTYYFLKNMEGDVVGLLEKDSGSVVARYTYDDWGNCVSVENASGYTVGNFNPFRYRGYYFDQESGFYYVGSRYYDPEIGRWISPDAMENLGINGNVPSYNLYVYCLNDPINGYDPDGCLNLEGVASGGLLVATGLVIIGTCGIGLIGIAAVATGATMVYTAATDSVMVMDLSGSIPIGSLFYLKGGGSLVFDFSENGGIYGYLHGGGGMGYSKGPTFSEGIVQNFNKPNDYSGPFNDCSLNINGYGGEYCYNPERSREETTKAFCFTFGGSFSYSAGMDFYTHPFVLKRWEVSDR